ncbi:hypothetical protein [Halomonas campaniensis]
MTAFAIDFLHHCAAARGVVVSACGRRGWYGYFMTGVPAAMS